MDIYLGLGSNLGDRRAHLAAALSRLRAEDIDVHAVSPVVETPALLPEGAPSDWNRPFLNAVIRCGTALAPETALERIKAVEAALGRATEGPRWAPRPIDIDILLWGHELIHTPRLEVPHPGLTQRAFVLTPLAALAPGLTVPGRGPTTVLGYARALRHRIPLWMGILNVTPDSFSDGGELLEAGSLEARLEAMLEAGVQIVDVGAESTRPGAAPLSADAEWARLEMPLTRVLAKVADLPLRPLVSIDTYHADVARRALAAGADIVNDVAGLTDERMIELAAASGNTFVAMHSLTVPADRTVTLPPDRAPGACLREWVDRRLEVWTAAGIALDRVIFDPGIGFGKTPLQSLALLRDVAAFSPPELRVLVGHSRKSFMGTFGGRGHAERDLVTVGASLNLCAQGVDILRVHDVPSHVAAYRGWVHLLPP